MANNADALTTLMATFKDQIAALGYTIMSANLSLKPTSALTENEKTSIEQNPTGRLNVNVSL